MKKALLIIGMIVIFFAGCKKDDILEASKVEMKDVTMERGWEHVKMSGEYSYPQALEGMKILVSSNENMEESVEYVCALDDMKFDVTIDNLEAGATYYYRYEYDNGYDKVKGDKENFVTVGKPVVVTNNVGNITMNSAVLSGSVTNNDVENKINVRGFCWSKNTNPTISGSHNNNGNSSGTGTSSFTYNLSYLESNTKYYVRAYAKTDWGVVYGEEKSFVTMREEPEVPEEPIVLPTVTTNSVTNITTNSATCGGNVTSDGNGTVTARGICWSETSEPKIDNLYSEENDEGTGTGSFTSSMTNLKANTTYYVRAYATNEAGTVYGEVKSFRTLDEEPEETISGTENGHDYVDLGLPSGLKWATCNVGASKATDYGDYFAWGETGTKSYYSNLNCPTFGLSISQLQTQGYIDSEGNLTAQYDAATANWGGTWRMPTYDELNELLTNCTWTWTTQNGVNGYNVEGPNGNSIFLPAAGDRNGSSLDYAGSYGYYWSSTPYDFNFGDYSYYLHFSSGSLGMYDDYRNYGLSVRPVFGGNFEEPEEPDTPGTNQTFNVNGVSFTMISVEGGTFKMGAQSSDSGGDNYDSDAYSEESPVHDVTLSSYYIGETEVTQELWEAVMGSNPSEFSGYPQRPVETVSWNDCQTFIEKLNQLTGKNFRLPTEAEWEYAARGGNKSNGYKYSGSNTIDDVAWYGGTQNVKTKQANELGIYDMSGNVWEWCQDWYGSYSSGSQTDPTGPSSGSLRVLRGGSWGNVAWSCRVSYRSSDYPYGRDSYYGFRLILQELQ